MGIQVHCRVLDGMDVADGDAGMGADGYGISVLVPGEHTGERQLLVCMSSPLSLRAAIPALAPWAGDGGLPEDLCSGPGLGCRGASAVLSPCPLVSPLQRFLPFAPSLWVCSLRAEFLSLLSAYCLHGDT